MNRHIELNIVMGKVLYDLGGLNEESDIHMIEFDSLVELTKLVSEAKLKEIKSELDVPKVMIDAVCINANTPNKTTNVEILLMSDGNYGQVIER